MLSSIRNLWRDRKIEFVYGLIAILLTVVALTIELSDDEAYYWSWTLRPALSYFDHPPLLAWILWCTTHVFGKTLLAVRLPALVCFGSMTYLASKWMKRHGIARENAMALAVGSPLFFIFGWMTLPDVIFLPLALLTVGWAMDRKYVAASLVLGLSVLAKWHGLLLMPGLLAMVILQEQDWKSRLTACLKLFPIGFILQAPVLIWNSQHDWISFHYHLVERQKSFGTFSQTLGRGVGFGAGFLLICGFGFLYLAWAFAMTRSNANWNGNSNLNSNQKIRLPEFDHEDRILLALALPYLAIFGLSALKGETRIYWTGFALFPLAILFLKSVSLETRKRFRVVSMASSFWMCLLLIVVLYMPIGFYFKTAVEKFRPYDIRFSPAGGFTGWEAWAAQQIAEENGNEGRVLYLAADFRQASQLLWSSDLKFEQVGAVEPSHQYLIWPDPDRSRYSKVVVFGDNNRGLNDYKWHLVCDKQVPLPQLDRFKVKLLSHTVKVIEDVECTQIVAN